MKKIFTITMSLLLCLTLLGGACAEAVAPCASNYFTSAYITVSPTGSGSFSITFNAIGAMKCSTLGVSTYRVERQNDDGSWTSVTGNITGETGSGVFTYSFSRSYSGDAGETYRVVAVFIGADSTGSQAKLITSGSVSV